MIDPLDTFKIEAREHLERLESVLLELESRPDDRELIDTAFRAMHTIKGAGGMFGFHDLTNFTHHLETALDKVRNGSLFINAELIGIFLDAGDHIGKLLNNTQFDAHQKITSEQLLNRLYAVVPHSNPEQSEFAAEDHAAPEMEKLKALRIRFKPDAATFQNGFDTMPILRELKSLGDCIVTTHMAELPDFGQFDPEQSYLRWDLILATNQPLANVEDVFLFVAQDWQISIEAVDLLDSDEISDRLGELLVSRGILNSADLEQALDDKPEIGRLLADKGLVSNSDINAALAEQKLTRELKQKSSGDATDPTIRVPASRLDNLMNLVGELVIVQARLNQVASREQNDDIISIAEELDLLTTQMRDQTFSIRMLPIGSTFGRFRRLVRDLSLELNKQIQLETLGAETELDKMVIDKLADPLVHLIRNSIDHGIESAEERLASGKPASGKITLSAEHANSQVVIKIIDDGKGLDLRRIREKAVERKLILADSEMSDEDIQLLIFEPGFSTAAIVSDVSGRGVGMDVVKRSIQELGGKIFIHTEAGKGTEFTVQLPMTLAIIEGLMVSVGGENYVLPLSSVEECIELQESDHLLHSRKRIVEVRGEQIPFLYLREWFDTEGQRPAIEQVVVTHIGSDRFGFCVDEVVGQYQTVIKRLGKLYENAVGYSGATILGDGSVAIILDPHTLMEAAGREQSHLRRNQTSFMRINP